MKVNSWESLHLLSARFLVEGAAGVEPLGTCLMMAVASPSLLPFSEGCTNEDWLSAGEESEATFSGCSIAAADGPKGAFWASRCCS